VFGLITQAFPRRLMWHKKVILALFYKYNVCLGYNETLTKTGIFFSFNYSTFYKNIRTNSFPKKLFTWIESFFTARSSTQNGTERERTERNDFKKVRTCPALQTRQLFQKITFEPIVPVTVILSDPPCKDGNA